MFIGFCILRMFCSAPPSMHHSLEVTHSVWPTLKSGRVGGILFSFQVCHLAVINLWFQEIIWSEDSGAILFDIPQSRQFMSKLWYFWSKNWHFMIKCNILCTLGFIKAVHFPSICLCDLISCYAEIQDFPLAWPLKTASLLSWPYVPGYFVLYSLLYVIIIMVKMLCLQEISVFSWSYSCILGLLKDSNRLALKGRTSSCHWYGD